MFSAITSASCRRSGGANVGAGIGAGVGGTQRCTTGAGVGLMSERKPIEEIAGGMRIDEAL